MRVWGDEEPMFRDDYESFVCPECVDDEILQAAIGDELEDEACSFCSGGNGAPLRVALEVVDRYLKFHYSDPGEELPHVSAEGGYQGNVEYATEIVADLGVWRGDELSEAVSGAFAGVLLAKKDYFGTSRFDELSGGWRAFAETIMHRKRFVFLRERARRNTGYVPVARMLPVLGQLFRSAELLTRLPAGAQFVRARVVKAGERLTRASEVGTAPNDRATYPNRMSPAGIAMFYGAEDEATAVVETHTPEPGEPRDLALATFKTLRGLRVLDLTNLPPVPSMFDLARFGEAQAFTFLKEFERSFTAPVERDGRAHFEYAPTQVVAEYVRYELRTRAGRMDGILYRSARSPKGRKAIVVFAEALQCLPHEGRDWSSPEPLLELVALRHLPENSFRYPTGKGKKDDGPSGP